MDIRKLQRAIVDGLEDVKAQNIRVFNTEHLSPLFERVIVATGASNRQTKALAASVRDSVKSRGLQVLRTEGEENGEWIIVDCAQAVVHIMQPNIRSYYHLEELWGEKPVRLRFGAAKPAPNTLTKAAPAKSAAKKSSAKATPARAAPARSAPAGSAAKPARKVASAASKPAAGRAAPRKAPVRAAAGTGSRKTPARKSQA